MKKEKKFESKLAAYSALAAGVLALGANANAQIVYTDVDPDETLSGATADYDLDMDNDGMMDFQIQLTVGTSSNSVRIVPMTGNEVLGSYTAGWMYPFPLNANDAIDSQQATWNGTANGGYLTMAWAYTTGATYGNWFGMTDKYLGLRFIVGSSYHHGWARLDVNSDGSSFTIKDYAYNSTADAAINAGQTAASIDEGLLKDVSVYTYGKTLFLNMNGNDIDNGNIRIINMIGQEVVSNGITSNNMEIKLENLESGVYVVAIETAEGSYTRKVHIK